VRITVQERETIDDVWPVANVSSRAVSLFRNKPCDHVSKTSAGAVQRIKLFNVKDRIVYLMLGPGIYNSNRPDLELEKGNGSQTILVLVFLVLTTLTLIIAPT
jgi:hypothetical protein